MHARGQKFVNNPFRSHVYLVCADARSIVGIVDQALVVQHTAHQVEKLNRKE